MPELPEVETIKRGLESEIIGAKITDVKFFWPGSLKEISEKKFKSVVLGRKITKIARRAKNLIITIGDDKYLLLHMKMTGHLLVEPATKKVNEKGNWVELEDNLGDSFNQYIRAVFWLDNGKIIAFSDLRKFGYIKLLSKEELDSFLDTYGPEPFSSDYSEKYLKEIFAKKNIAIKKVLMDQSIIAGIGNIYADEILWSTKIHPLTSARSLSDNEIAAIVKASRVILKRAIDRGGTSTSDFRNIKGGKGNFEKELAVYKRDGQKCPRDGAIIEKIKVGGRGTHFCPKEQRLKK